MKNFLAGSTMACAVVASLGLACSAESLANEVQREMGDLSYNGEILASAPLKSGAGRMEIIRTSEDGIDGVAISVEAPIGTRFVEQDPSRARLPLADRTSIKFRELTGQALPEEAFEALVNVEQVKQLSADLPLESAGEEANGLLPRSASCQTSNSPDAYYANCYDNGPIMQVVGGVDDVCLLTAAIKGNHTMELSYRAINGKYYQNFQANVTQGHYRAVYLKTGVARARKGQIFNASNSDYSRLEYFGKYFDADLDFYDPTKSDCQKAVD